MDAVSVLFCVILESPYISSYTVQAIEYGSECLVVASIELVLSFVPVPTRRRGASWALELLERAQ